jgi:hypothetical protein
MWFENFRVDLEVRGSQMADKRGHSMQPRQFRLNVGERKPGLLFRLLVLGAHAPVIASRFGRCGRVSISLGHGMDPMPGVRPGGVLHALRSAASLLRNGTFYAICPL